MRSGSYTFRAYLSPRTGFCSHTCNATAPRLPSTPHTRFPRMRRACVARVTVPAPRLSHASPLYPHTLHLRTRYCERFRTAVWFSTPRAPGHPYGSLLVPHNTQHTLTHALVVATLIVTTLRSSFLTFACTTLPCPLPAVSALITCTTTGCYPAVLVFLLRADGLDVAAYTCFPAVAPLYTTAHHGFCCIPFTHFCPYTVVTHTLTGLHTCFPHLLRALPPHTGRFALPLPAYVTLRLPVRYVCYAYPHVRFPILLRFTILGDLPAIARSYGNPTLLFGCSVCCCYVVRFWLRLRSLRLSPTFTLLRLPRTPYTHHTFLPAFDVDVTTPSPLLVITLPPRYYLTLLITHYHIVFRWCC